MRVGQLLKQLKKRMRRRKTLLTLGAVCLWCFGAAAASVGWPAAAAARAPSDSSANPTASIRELRQDLAGGADTRTVSLRLIYVCGEERQKFGELNKTAVETLAVMHPEWQLGEHDGRRIVFVKRIEDLSPTCKEQAYFGLDQDGNLTLYDGNPEHKQVIHTFFPLNIHHLQSRLPSETLKALHNGIRVKDMQEYNSVLSTFSEFSQNPHKS